METDSNNYWYRVEKALEESTEDIMKLIKYNFKYDESNEIRTKEKLNGDVS